MLMALLPSTSRALPYLANQVCIKVPSVYVQSIEDTSLGSGICSEVTQIQLARNFLSARFLRALTDAPVCRCVQMQICDGRFIEMGRVTLYYLLLGVNKSIGQYCDTRSVMSPNWYVSSNAHSNYTVSTVL